MLSNADVDFQHCIQLQLSVTVSTQNVSTWGRKERMNLYLLMTLKV